MKIRIMACSWVLASSVLQTVAQTNVDLRTQSKSVDFSGASSTKPMKAGTALPASCSVGELYFQTNATPGANIYVCSAANIWTAAGVASVFGRTGAVTSQASDYSSFFPTLGTVITDFLPVWSTSGVLDSSTVKRDPSSGAIGFGKGLFLQPVTVAFNGGSPNLDLSTGNYFDLTVTGAATLTTSNGALVNGAQSFFTWHICQDGTGGWAVTRPAGFVLASAIDTTANICTVQSFWWTGTNAIPAAPAFTTQTAMFVFGPVRAAPGSNPGAGFMDAWFDSTGLNFQTLNASGAKSGTALAKGPPHNKFYF